MGEFEFDFVAVLQSPAARIEYQNIHFKCQQTKTSLINIKIISIHNKKKTFTNSFVLLSSLSQKNTLLTFNRIYLRVL